MSLLVITEGWTKIILLNESKRENEFGISEQIIHEMRMRTLLFALQKQLQWLRSDHINIKEENAGKMSRSYRQKDVLRKWNGMRKLWSIMIHHIDHT